MRKSSLLCQSLDEKLEQSLTDRFLDVMAIIEGLDGVSLDSRDHLLREVHELQAEVDDLAQQMSVLDMSLLAARMQVRERDERLKNTYVTNPARFGELYEQGKELGKGKFGVVYECRPKYEQERVLAVKVLDCKAENMTDLYNEVRLLSCVRSPNIVQMVETFMEGGQFFLVMEKVNGGELMEMLASAERYTEKDSRDAFRQIANALRVLRHHQIVHRDLKPENLLLTEASKSAQVKLADFGLAVQIKNDERLTEGVGTPNFIAPEVLRCLENDAGESDGENEEEEEEEELEEGYSFAADWWSAGCILFMMLCGKLPFGHHDDIDEMYDAIVRGKVSLEGPEWNSVSEDAKKLVRGLLVTNDAKRISADQVMQSAWMSSSALDERPLAATQVEIKNFNAKRRWKSSILAVMASNRVRTLGDMRVAAAKRKERRAQGKTCDSPVLNRAKTAATLKSTN